ncbi:hypothetical protein QM716_28315 [Rhodococcus sp. IEGM 1409]|nr:hypothetical protein [Rhodococcus sp. IEGM 1409]
MTESDPATTALSDALNTAIRRRDFVAILINQLQKVWEAENRKIVRTQHLIALAKCRHPSGRGRFSNPTAPQK